MPPYATVADVQRLEPLREFKANTQPNTAQVVALLEDVAAEIDGALAARKYKLPVQAASAGTPTLALRLLRRLNALGVRAQIQAGAAATREGAAEDSWRAYQDALAALRDGRTELPDAATDAAQQVAV
jgi:hypothetical protein